MAEVEDIMSMSKREHTYEKVEGLGPYEDMVMIKVRVKIDGEEYGFDMKSSNEISAFSMLRSAVSEKQHMIRILESSR